jgi:CRISPR-associated protein (TIGR03986 family)
MPGKPDKPHRIRVKTLDGKPRDQDALNKLKSNQLGMPHLDIVSTSVVSEFIICAAKDRHIEQVRAKLQAAGLAVIEGRDTAVPKAATPNPAPQQPRGNGSRPPSNRASQGVEPQNPQPQRQRQDATNTAPNYAQQQPQQGCDNEAKPLLNKPYGFVSLPQGFQTATPIWHDGTTSKGRLSGEIRFELETLTPLLVGWERGQVGDNESDWPVPATLAGVGQLANNKSVLCPLRAPWGKRPVIIPGDSLKGLLRHELGALLGAPMERVAERSYSYRPNALFPNQPNPRLIARIARVPNDGVEMKALDGSTRVRVPTKLELLSTNLRYKTPKNNKKRENDTNYYRFDDGNGATYRGGQGAGERLNSKRNLHNRLTANPSQPTEMAHVPPAVQDGYLATLRHLIDLDHGHFSARHPDVPKVVEGKEARERILKAAKDEVFQPGDYIWVEWDTEKKCIVSLGWHYYYHWAYVDTVRKDADAPRLERHGLFPLDKEREKDGDGAPRELSAVRRLFGYTGDNEGSAGIGEGDHAQLMGRVFVNAGLEVVGKNDSDEQRFLRPTFLKELGMPRPSAVEHYLKQPYHPKARPSDQATLVTYGDAAGYDAPGELAGRKFYLDRKDAYGSDGKGAVPGPAKDSTDRNRQNDRSTLALEASKPGRKFRFTVRFRDLDAAELAAVLVALCPDQFKRVLGGTHRDGYCSKLGYARPLGWGSVRIEAKQLLLLNQASETPTLNSEPDVAAWVKTHHQKTSTQDEWLAIHRRNHPNAGDYPRAKDREGNETIYTYHTRLRAEHSRNRRYKRPETP